ncbi:DUF4440 domain-containing protein [Mucilaginibacter aquatilis]|uniref:DUF4440 domain-containing protein n=1 Tax=Mucilaginibacter aquatilis TaxID=1517760 RepID=A0A6I4IQA4_9SPHI|nr:DUF4440 domain-containing protein [Mucilaginibacter aquatilis]MVN90814.1 hypothetical protein [Mucilaginibacter aquatilis]
MNMIKAFLTVAAVSISTSIFAQTATVQTVIKAEDDFAKLTLKKGIKDAFLTVADQEGIVFKPEAVKITEFYSKIDKQPGTLTWTPKFARIATNGDLAVTAGPYVYQNGKADDDKVYGDYVSIWKMDASTKKLKLFTNLGIQHPQTDKVELTDIKDPASASKVAPSTDPFNPKKIIIDNDRQLNQALRISTVGAYKEFFMPEGHYYFPGFNPMVGSDKVLQFFANQAIVISGETVDANRSTSNDLAYSYGRARIQKGNIVSNYNYVRIWQQDEKHRWNILLEILSAVENE